MVLTQALLAAGLVFTGVYYTHQRLQASLDANLHARAMGVAGSVVIRGIVRKDGTIDNVEIIKDLPYGLGEAAREAVQQWRFHPATYQGEPIDVYYTVTVNFRLR